MFLTKLRITLVDENFIVLFSGSTTMENLFKKLNINK